MEKQKQYEFFKGTPKKVIEIAQKVDKAPFLKLGLLTILASASFGLVLGGLYGGTVKYENNSKLEQIKATKDIEVSKALALENAQRLHKNQEANLGRAYNTIKNVSAEEFDNFLDYLKYHQNMYDERAKIVSDALIETSMSTRARVLSGFEESKNLQGLIDNHKKEYENMISKAQIIYSDVKNDNAKPLAEDVNKLFVLFNNYKANLIVRDVPIENKIHSYMFTSMDSNAQYNKAHNIIDVSRKAEKNMEEGIKQFKNKR